MTIKVEKQLSNDKDKVLIIVIFPFFSRLEWKELYQQFFNDLVLVTVKYHQESKNCEVH